MHNILGKIVLSAISLVSLFSCKTDNSITDLGPFTVLWLDPFTYEYTSGTLEKDNLGKYYVRDDFYFSHYLAVTRVDESVDVKCYSIVDPEEGSDLKYVLNKISFDDFEVGEKVIFKWKPGMEDYYAFKTIPVFEMYKFSNKIELTKFTRVKGKILNSDKIWYGSCDYLFEDEKESKYISYVGCNSSSDMTVTWNLQNSQFSDKESYDCYVVEKDNLALFLINNKEVW